MWIRSAIIISGVVVVAVRAVVASLGAWPDGEVTPSGAHVRVAIHAHIGACAVDLRSRPIALQVGCADAAPHATRPVERAAVADRATSPPGGT